MRFSVLSFFIGIFLVSVNSSPVALFPSQIPPLQLSSIPSTVTLSDPLTVELRNQDIRDGLAKVHPTTKNLSTKTISNIFLTCLENNDFSTNDATTAATQPQCMALGVFPASSLKLGPIIDEIVRLASVRLNIQSAGRSELNETSKESAELGQRIVDIWSALLNDGYMLAKASAAAPAPRIHKEMQDLWRKATALRKRSAAIVGHYWWHCRPYCNMNNRR
jgi:hypothetical protein